MKIKLFFVDFWPDFNPANNFFYNLLSEYYEVELSPEPDILFFSVFGNRHRTFTCLKIFYTGENYKPSRFDAHLSLSFYQSSERNIRFPVYLLYHDLNKLILKRKAEDIIHHKKKFCCFVVSNKSCEFRNRFFQKLSSYKKVDSGGKHLNNIGYIVQNKHAFLQDYKFTICFENISAPGYTTEKIVEAMYGECIPIYWGNRSIHEEFNTKSFINIHEFDKLDEVIERIMFLDRNDEAYIEMLREPWLSDNKIDPIYTYKFLADKITEALHKYQTDLSFVELPEAGIFDVFVDKISRRLRGERIYNQ